MLQRESGQTSNQVKKPVEQKPPISTPVKVPAPSSVFQPTQNTSSPAQKPNIIQPHQPPEIPQTIKPQLKTDIFGSPIPYTKQEIQDINENRYGQKYVPGYYENIRKTNIAGSPENYDKYLNIVRSHPEFVAIHSFSTPYLGLDLAFASNKPTITGASEREEILIKQLHEWKGSPESKGDVGRMWTNAIPNNPFVQIAGSEAIGAGVGKVVGGFSGRVAAKYGPAGLKLFNYGQIAAGGIIAAPQAVELYETARRGETGKFAGKSLMFGLTFGSGMEGYREGGSAPKLWGKYKGLNSYEAGVSRTINKPGFNPNKTKFFNNPLAKDITILKSDFNPTRIQMANAQYMMKQDIYTNKVNPKFPDTTLQNVQSLNKLQPAQKKGIINTVLDMTRKTRTEGYGGAFSPKDTTHDIDLAFKSGKEPVILEDITKRLGIEGKVVDTHKMLSTGEQTEILGAKKLPSIKTETGVKRIDVRDQFDRISQGAVFSPAKREDKDIINSIKLIKKIYGQQYPEGIPEKSALKIKNFEDVYTRAAKTKDFIITESSEKQIYNTGKIWEYQQKFYKKILPESYLKKKFIDYTRYPKEYLKGGFGKKQYDPIKRLIDSLPDVTRSISPGLRSPSIGFSIPYFSPSTGRNSSSGRPVSSGGKSLSGGSKSFSPSSRRYNPSPSPVKIPSPSPPKSPSYNPPSPSPPYTPSKSPPRSPPYYSPPYSPPSVSPPYSPPSKSPSYSPPPSNPYYPYLAPSPSLYGRGSRGSDWKIRNLEKKNRKAKIGSVFGDFKEIKIKGVDI